MADSKTESGLRPRLCAKEGDPIGSPSSFLHFHEPAPAVLVGEFAVLDGTDALVERRGLRAHFPVGAIAEFAGDFRLLEHGFHVDVRKRGDDHGGTAAAHFLEGLQFLERDGALLHFHAQVHGHLLQRLVRDGRKDTVGERGDVLVPLDAEEVGRAELVDKLARGRIQVQQFRIALLVGELVGLEGVGVIRADLVAAGALRGRPVIIARDDGRAGLQVRAVVRAHRRAHHGKDGLRIRHQLHLGMHAHQQRAEVHRSAQAVRREEFHVAADAGLAHLVEHLFVRAGHAQVVRSPLQAGGVLVGTEHRHAAVLLPEGLEALKAGNRIMEDLREGVEREGEGLRRFGFGPLAVLEVGDDDRAGPVGVEA